EDIAVFLEDLTVGAWSAKFEGMICRGYLKDKRCRFWLAGVGAALFFCVTATAQTAPRQLLQGHVPAVVSRLAPQGRLPATNQLRLAIGLPLRNEAELDELLRQLYDPASTNYHKFLTPPEFAARFGPAEKDYDAVRQFAAGNGLTVAATYPNRVVLDVAGSAATIEGAFHVTLHRYRHPAEPRDFFAPDAEPSVPADLKILSVEGLSDFSLPRRADKKIRAAAKSPSSFNGTGPGHEYAGNDFRNAYVPGSPLKGAGQTVALLEYSDYYMVDITNYENHIGATNYVPLTNVVVNGDAPGTTHNDEVALDIEMAIAMAPMLSRVIVYEKNSVASSLLNAIATDNLAKQVSSSWTVGPWSSSTATTYDNILKNMAAQGQSYFQSSGDSDAYTGTHPLDSGTTVPTDSPYATIVGGTTLTMSGYGVAWNSETVWNYNLTGIPNEGSGGGISSYYTRPSWQTNISMAANGGSTTYRNIPDVSFTADDIYVCYNNGDTSGSSYFMGTSAAAPLWAGFCALINQQAATVNPTNTVGFLNPALYNLASSSCYGSCFHDITTGDNIGTNTAGMFYAVAGYDLATGLGTPNGTNLINALVWPPPTFTNQPAGKIVTNGASVTFTAAASSTTPVKYFWLFSGTNLMADGNVSGVTSNKLSIAAATTNNAGNYQLVASNFTGFVTSSVAVLTVGFAPTVSVSPASLTLPVGSNAVFTATPGGTSPFGYRWKKNGTNFAGSGITGTNSSVLTLTGVTTNSAAGYTVVVTNLFGSITSSAATLTVGLPPAITGSLTNRNMQCGSNITYTITASGTAPLAIQWRFD
ncbi:MAG: protease pro-enzyme activation domain-containing protein, partial [Verrucomicrobiota bacterium]